MDNGHVRPIWVAAAPNSLSGVPEYVCAFFDERLRHRSPSPAWVADCLVSALPVVLGFDDILVSFLLRAGIYLEVSWLGPISAPAPAAKSPNFFKRP